MENRITKEMVVASLISETTSRNLHRLLSDAKDVEITKDNIQVNYPVLKALADIKKYLEERKKSEDAPDKERIAIRKEGYDSVLAPIEEILKKAEPQIISINESIIADEKRIAFEIEKQNEIRTRHVEFVNEITRSVMGADSNKDLATIQKLVGSEKSRTKFYGEYHPIISKTCDSLIGLIESRKEFIKNNNDLLKRQKEAQEKGDEVLALSLKEEIEYGSIVIRQSAETLANEALAMVSEVSLLSEELKTKSIKPRLNRLSYEVVDIKLLAQKMPEMVELTPNAKEIGAFMKKMDEEGKLDESIPTVIHGIKFYNKKFYL